MTDRVPATMRVARSWGPRDIRVEEVPVPRPSRGEALIRIEACGLCGSDALDWYVARKAPVVLGHEPAGVVVEIGDAVSAVAPGDRVFIHHHAPCGECAECQRSLWSNCATWRASHLDPGGFAQYVVAPEVIISQDTLRLPDQMDDDTATFIEPVACCLRAIRRHGRLATSDSLHVIGLGAMGLVMIQLGRILGAGAITGSDFIDERRRLAVNLGADTVLDPGSSTHSPVAGPVGDRGADVVIVCPGDSKAVAAGMAAAAPGGRVVCFTPLPPDRPLTIDQSQLYFREVSIAQSYSCGPDETRDALALLSAGDLAVTPLITYRAGLDGVADALDRIRNKTGIKTIIYPSM